jgi:hypothetical protein
MAQNGNSVDREAIIVEFQALRTELLQRANLQWNIFVFQLTAAGVVFSFALSNPSHTPILLILPVITYALAGRYVSQGLGIEKIAEYIREVLEVKMNGQLHWEAWLRIQPPRPRTLSWLSPLYLVFPGVAVIALASAAPYVWANSSISAGKRVLIITIWFVGVVVTVMSFRLIDLRASRHRIQARRLRLQSNSRSVLDEDDLTVKQVTTKDAPINSVSDNPPTSGSESSG